MAEHDRHYRVENENKQPDDRDEEEPGHPFWPTHVLDQAIILYLLGGVLLTLAILVPFRLHAQADPLHTPEGIKPEWFFLPTYQAIKYVPKTVGVVAFGFAGLLFIIWPFLDQLLDRRFGPRAYRKIGAVALAIVLLLGMVGWASERTFTLMDQEYHIDLLGIPSKASPEYIGPDEARAGESATERTAPKEALGHDHTSG